MKVNISITANDYKIKIKLKHLIYNIYIIHIIILRFQCIFMTLHTFDEIFVKSITIIFVLCDERLQDEPKTLLNNFQLGYHRVTRKFRIMREDGYRENQHVIWQNVGQLTYEIIVTRIVFGLA